MIVPPSLPQVGLGLVAAYAALRLLDPAERWAALPVGGDRVEHAIVAYLLVSFALAAFPRVRLWVTPLGLVGLGVVVEVGQAHPVIVGGGQLGDVAANTAGALAATFCFWLARYRRDPDSDSHHNT